MKLIRMPDAEIIEDFDLVDIAMKAFSLSIQESIILH